MEIRIFFLPDFFFFFRQNTPLQKSQSALDNVSLISTTTQNIYYPIKSVIQTDTYTHLGSNREEQLLQHVFIHTQVKENTVTTGAKILYLEWEQLFCFSFTSVSRMPFNGFLMTHSTKPSHNHVHLHYKANVVPYPTSLAELEVFYSSKSEKKI